MAIPAEFIDDLVARTDIVDVVSDYVRLSPKGGSLWGLCPFHGEKTPSFHVVPDRQMYHCFGCGKGGGVITFIKEVENLPYLDALRLLAKRAGVEFPEGDLDEAGRRRRGRLLALNKEAARFFHSQLHSPQGREGLEYLQRRGLSKGILTRFGLGFAPESWDSLLNAMAQKGFEKKDLLEAGLAVNNQKGGIYDRFRNRVMYPIFDTRGNVVGFGGRKLEGDGAKYINSPESIVYNKSKTLYALNFAKKSQHNYLILTEGYMDVISLHQAGFTSAIAGCGTALTQDQARLAAKHSKNIYLCYDSDEAGQKAAKKAIELFAPLECNLKVLKVPDGKDPDEFIRKQGSVAFEKLLASARATTRYEVDSIMAKYDLDDIAQKVEFSREIAQLLSKLKSAVEQDEYIKYICHKANISPDALTLEIKKLRQRAHRSDVNSEMRRTAGNQSAPTAHKKSEARLKKAECGLLCTLLSERNVFEKLKDKVHENLFTIEFHREIFLKALELFNSNAPFGITELAHAFSGREGEFSEVFLQTVEIADPKSAAVDFIKVIEEETLNIKIARATQAGDVNLLSELLKQQKSLKG